MKYLLRERERTFAHDLVALASITSLPQHVLEALGPFTVELYWFNRRLLEAVEGIGDKRRVQELVNDWSGGLMVFRDDFRVNPYGAPDDDWLDLDRKAFASSGYKVNRKQIIGRIRITRAGNPALIDQTNRQGLRDCDEKQALVAILKNMLEVELRAFLNQVDDDMRAQLPLNFDDVSERIQTEENSIQQNIRTLFKRHPELREDPSIASAIVASVERLDSLLANAKQLADSFERGRTQLLNLAGLGLMVEIVGHELNRATQHALSTLADAETDQPGAQLGERLVTLKAQLKTLQKRLRILDPLATSGRQVKESFDLIAWTEEILASHEAQFRRHDIRLNIEVVPARTREGLVVRMVKGMIVQILENLISNSVYWLKQARALDRDRISSIRVRIDRNKLEVHFSDNGPGIPRSRKDSVFQPFVTTKPPGAGKGLGLYIAREIARYNGASLVLSDESAGRGDRLSTFILKLKGDGE